MISLLQIHLHFYKLTVNNKKGRLKMVEEDVGRVFMAYILVSNLNLNN